MAKNGVFPFLGRILAAIILGALGYIFGVFLQGMEIFPELAWGNIFLFLGAVGGFFKQELVDYLGS